MGGQRRLKSTHARPRTIQNDDGKESVPRVSPAAAPSTGTVTVRRVRLFFVGGPISLSGSGEAGGNRIRQGAGTLRSWSPGTKSRSPKHLVIAGQAWPSSSLCVDARSSLQRSRRPSAESPPVDQTQVTAPHWQSHDCWCGNRQSMAGHLPPTPPRSALNSGSPGVTEVAKPRVAVSAPVRSTDVLPVCDQASSRLPAARGCAIESGASRRRNVDLLSVPRDAGLPCSR